MGPAVDNPIMIHASPVSLRHYGVGHASHTHEFVQIVVPVQGALCLEVAGRQACLTESQAAYVGAGAAHAQEARGGNCSLVLELDSAEISPALAENLAGQRFFSLPPGASAFVSYMALSLRHRQPSALMLAQWKSLLLAELAPGDSLPGGRLATLLARIDANPAAHWTIAAMARTLGVSASRVHVLFQHELGTTPRAWLVQRRCAWARTWLETTTLPLADIACRAGYADQAGMTRAIRHETGLPPGAYRRLWRELETKPQDPPTRRSSPFVS
ncbi:AraC family transcriptional regulator [Acetobacter sp. TBRC 12305]|uniref:Helix-turn-helix domain-containing protein n=1 Tax=Acetobacter garciniae TaxID=2817435 RepID=A0A939KMM4_9PROT|nr:AraC family transcriptional regulator [Acetobacter garciniae]MBO1324715.1 helix-turn-helix domain-containing protein [Acetobacter garciniae]MBX0344406.1 AraC family transcriptional regulator [Acetobacter garciniae]